MSKKALVTGGNRGIGLEVVRLLLDAGFEVVVVGRKFEGFEFADHKAVKTVAFDLAQTEKIPALVDELGDLSVLVNNAGVMYSLPYDQYPDEDVESMLAINIKAPVALIREVGSRMAQGGGGRIVNNASIAGQIGHPDVWYGITKAGLINATKSFSKILGPSGVVINAVAPGPVTTDMLDVISQARKEQIKKTVISGRFATAQEVAQTVFWLATDCPGYINGTCVDINNGFFPR